MIALLARFSIAFYLPLHSDDYYRFFLDGLLILDGIDPYGYTPHDLELLNLIPENFKPYFDKLNSSNYFSIYPVTNQTVFAIAAWIGGSSISGFVFCLRVILVFFEMVSISILFLLLGKLGRNVNLALLYAINPFILLEVVGNLHFEGMMLTFILIGFLTLYSKRYIVSGACIGLAVAIKLTPLIFFPFILKYLNLKNFVWFFSSAFVVIILLFLPIWLFGSWANFLSSIKLYYGTFEFNASIYYLLREIGYMIKGYNVISELSVLLSLFTFILVWYAALKTKIDTVTSLIQAAIFGYTIYLLFGMVVHPWYIIPLFGLGILGGFKYPLIWSYLIYLSYFSYTQIPYKENYLFIFIQYGIVIILGIFEWRDRITIHKNEFRINND